jgi:hypothetical protein
LATPSELDHIVDRLNEDAPGVAEAIRNLASWFDAFCYPATPITSGEDGDLVAYHYTSLASLENMVKASTHRNMLEVWAGGLASLNDQTELVLGLDVIQEIARRWPHPIPAALDMALTRAHQERGRGAYVFSLSRQRDSADLWDRYADQGQGVAIGFNLRALHESLGVFPIQVSYDVQSFCRRCLSAFAALCRYCNEYGRSLSRYPLSPQFVTPLHTLLSCVALQYKFSDPWEAEREVRVFQWNTAGQEDGLRRGGRNFAFHVEPRSCVVEILPGALCTSEQLSRLEALSAAIAVPE